ncbi:uncharacterized protein [Clytia hemisphaerica]|uniref:uncharacterized protein n=1 Tax=Clytia hemisphaerica TaxID=252671 RepID=UPI0034D5072C
MKKYMKYCPSYYRKNHSRLNIHHLDGTSSFKQKFTGDEKRFGSLDIDQPEFSDILMDKVISWLQQENPNPDEFPTEPVENLNDQELSQSHQFTPINLEQQGSSADSEFNHDQTSTGLNAVDVNFSGQHQSLLYSLQSPFAPQVLNQQQFPVGTNQLPAPLVGQGSFNNAQGFMAQYNAQQYQNVGLDGPLQELPMLETNNFHQQSVLQSLTFDQPFSENANLTGLVNDVSIDLDEGVKIDDGVDFTVIDSAPLNGGQECFDVSPTQCKDVQHQWNLGQNVLMDTPQPQTGANTLLTQQEIFNMIQSHFDQYGAEQDSSLGSNIPLMNPLDHQGVNNTFQNPNTNIGAQQGFDYASSDYIVENQNLLQRHYPVQQMDCNSVFQERYNMLQSPLTMESVSQRTSYMPDPFSSYETINSAQSPDMMPAENSNSQPNDNGSSLVELLLADPEEIHKFNHQQRHQRRSIIPQEFMNSTLLGHKKPTQEELIQQKLKELKARGDVDAMMDFVFGEARNYAPQKPSRRGRKPKNKDKDRFIPYDKPISRKNDSGGAPMFGFDSRQIKGSKDDVISLNQSRDHVFANQPINRTGKRKCNFFDDEDERMSKFPRHQL